MKVYIAGKITGNNKYKQKFAAAQLRVEQSGNIALNPAILPEGMTPKCYMSICLPMIDVADLVWFLDDYTESRGAMLEHAYCQYIGKQTAYGNDFNWMPLPQPPKED